MYTWDNNGNLLNDGTSAYTYDQANRIKTLTQGTNNYAFAYNGLSDRISQTVNSVVTRYALDPAAGLTQVLSDGTATYLYGLGRVAQQQTNMQYFGADGLGSARQLYNASGQIIANRRYDPFGNTISQSGVGASNYGFTGEWTDATGLEYLRARYYAPGVGRFVTRDAWPGDYQRPLSLNGWNYVNANPVNVVDPSGHGLNDYYVFVQGCSPILGQPLPCVENAPEWDWQVYLAFLRKQFQFPRAKDAQGQDTLVTWDEKGFPDKTNDPFILWAKDHAKFVRAPTSDPGGITVAVNATSHGGGSVFLIGHSAGGTAIVRYLVELKESGAPNPGIAGAVAVQAPLGSFLEPRGNWGPYVIAKQLGFERYVTEIYGDICLPSIPPLPFYIALGDRLERFGAWAKKQGINLRQISYADDPINPTYQVADIPQAVVSTQPGYAGPFDILKKHGYLLTGPGTERMLVGLFAEGVLR